MNLKKGDRVRFLNSVGGGIVSEIVSKDLVKVTDEDGFEIPTLVRECVLIENVNEENNLINKTPEPIASKQTPTPTKEEKKEDIIFEEIPDGDELKVAFAFVPQNVKKLQDTTFDWYFVNDSNYHLYYTIATKKDDGKYSIVENGILHRNTTFLVSTLDNGQLSDYEQIYVQIIAYKDDKRYEIQKPISQHLHIKPISFIKLHSFAENDYFDEPAMIFSLTSPETEYDLSNVDLNKVSENKERIFRTPKSQPKRQAEVLEIDLHINQLVDNTAGLSATDMLQYQLKIFTETMENNRKNKGQKIVFIHGKGNGTLRNEIIKLLKQKYGNCTYQDASFREYGFGATMITVK